MRLRLFIILLLVSSFALYSQPWLYSLSRQKTTKEYNFYEIQKAFDNYWKDKTISKGKGYKQFKRWEYFVEPRVYPYGEIPYSVIQQEMVNSLNNQSEASSNSWVFVGPSKVPKDIQTEKPGGAGRINCIAFHPTDSNIIWLGAPSGGAWKSVDGGLSWSTATDQLASICISDIVIHPTTPDIMYMATGDGDYGSANIYGIGILKSTNGGSTWQTTSVVNDITEFVNFRKIIFKPDNPATVLATSSKGIYRTTLGWNNYSIVKSGHFKDIEFHPTNSSIVYASSFSASGMAKIYRSTDGGASFEESMTGLNISGKVNRIELAVSRANNSVVYAVCSEAFSDGFYGLYKSVNSGLSWTTVYDNSKKNLLGWSPAGSDEGGQGTYDLTIAVSPKNANEVYIGGVNLWRSTDGGSNWKIVGLWYHDVDAEYVHADHHDLLFSPHNVNALYSGNDGGIYKSYDKGISWTDLSDGLSILQSYRMNNFEKKPGFILSGNQDNGTIMKSEDNWFQIIGGDGMECVFDRDNEKIIYGTLYYGDLRKSVNGGKSFNSIIPDGTLEGGWITPVTMHPEFSNTIYSGYQKVYKTTDGGNSWTGLTAFSSGSADLCLVEVSALNDKVIYAATISTLYKSVDGGLTWTDISSGLPQNAITSLSISETDPSEVWVTFSGYQSGQKVYHSKNGGQTWNNYSDGLPNLPVNCITYQKKSNKLLYAGTDLGVYYRDVSMSQWSKYGVNLPNVVVYDLEVLNLAKKLRAATHGRGIWETSIYENISQPYVDFNLTTPVACVDGSIKFSGNSVGTFDSIRWDFGSGAIPSKANGAGPHEVVYSSVGDKTVTLSGYKSGIAYIETKQNIVKIAGEIDFTVSPDNYSMCKGDSIVLYASGGFDFEWAPAAGLNTSEGERVVFSADETTTITVKASSGSCNAEKTVNINVTTNDNICDAILLNEGYNGPFNNKCASVEENEPVPPKGSVGSGCETQDGWCDGEVRLDNSIWFKFVAPSGGLVSFQTDGFDNQIAVYQADDCSDLLIGNYILLAANDDYPGKGDYSANIYEITGLTAGKTYWLQVDGSYGGVSGTFSILYNHHTLSGNEGIISETERIEVYPNPNNGSFSVDYSLKNTNETSVRIFNISGSLVYSGIFKPLSVRGTEKFNLHLKQGIYFIEIQNENNMFRRKLYVN